MAVRNGSNILVSWRRLAQEPEEARYNLYTRQGDKGQYSRLNTEPLSTSYYQGSSALIPIGSDIAVALVLPDGTEGALSAPFQLKSYDTRNIFVDIDYSLSPLEMADYSTKFVWPVDLDGDGEFDYVVDRLHMREGVTDKVEGYLRSGEHLWTVDMGPNEFICMGQDDQVVAYDIDCDGRGELIIQTSDGTRFWDSERNDWGAYLLGAEDTDGDGIVDYNNETQRNPPHYMTVVDGMTGREKASVEQTYSPYYNRTNKASLMGDEYNKHVGHVGVFYPDGVHPAVVMEYHTRTTDGAHHYYNAAWSFDYSNGTAKNWHQIFHEPTGGATFHQIRIADSDGDGCDEMVEGGYTMDHDGTTLFNTGIAHGDRFRTSDIDPERPGMETFAIQQNASDMLGQILYDAASGTPIKRWYLSEVGDVGRGECMDIDPDHLGYEMFSTMDTYLNDAQGNPIEGAATYFPTEGLWWDGALDRERVDSPDGNGYNADIRKYDGGKNTRLFEIAKESNYKYKCQGAKRGLFWGDIIGDWREELILRKLENDVCTGITGFSTDMTSDVQNIYCLQEDPAYRLQCTTRGYYQSPNTSFYLGYDMPRPPLPPCMQTDVVWHATDQFTDFQRATTTGFKAGSSVLIDLESAASLECSDAMAPSACYAMPVAGQCVTVSGSGSITSGTFWKSQKGRLVLDIPLTTDGTTYISEGTLEVNRTISAPVELRARGILAGIGSVSELNIEGALNYAEGVIAPGRQADVTACESGAENFALGTLTFRNGLNVTGRLFCNMDVRTASETAASDLLHVEGDVTLSAPLIFTIQTAERTPRPGRYKLVEYTGALKGDTTLCTVRGLSGISCSIEAEEGALWLVIREQREASNHVIWHGSESGSWDYVSANFTLENAATEFVAGDSIYFDDSATETNITLAELMPIGAMTVDNTLKDFTFSGNGGFSGTGGLTKRGTGALTLNAIQSDYTGATLIESGTVTVKELADGGIGSSLGAASSEAEHWQIGHATLVVDNSNTSTNRGLTLTDSATLRIPAGTTSLKGIVVGNGTLIKEGAGQLNITYGGRNTWSGGTVLRQGTLAMGCWNTTFGTQYSTIRVEQQGTIKIFDVNSSTTLPNLDNTLDVVAGGALTLVGGQRCRWRGVLQGDGDVSVSFPYVRGDVSTDMSQFRGTLTVTAGEFRLTKATDLSQATLALGAGVTVAHYKDQSGTTQGTLETHIGTLTSTASDCALAAGVYYIGSKGTDNAFAGTFASTAKVYKVGDGTLSLSGASQTAIEVRAGTLSVNNTTTPTTTGAITVLSGATLLGTGQTASVKISDGATLAYGKSLEATSIGKLTIKGNLTVAAGATIALHARRISFVRNDAFAVSGTIQLTAPKFCIELTGGTLQEGDSLIVFTDFEHFNLNGTPQFEPEIPAEGFYWDYSTLTTDGCLRIAAGSNGIENITADRVSKETGSYDLMGRRLPDGVIPKGLYIRNGKKVVR